MSCMSLEQMLNRKPNYYPFHNRPAAVYTAAEMETIKHGVHEDRRRNCPLWRWLFVRLGACPVPRNCPWVERDTDSILQIKLRTWYIDYVRGKHKDFSTIETITYVRQEDGTWVYDPEQTTEVFSRMVEFQAAPRDWDTPERQAELKAWGMAVPAPAPEKDCDT